MNRNHFPYDTSSGKMGAHSSTTKESFGIVKSNAIWDGTRRQLVLVLETSQMLTDEIEIQFQDNRMTIEAPLILPSESQTNKEDGLTVIGYSSIRLKPGYIYTHISSKAIDSKLIKIRLEYKTLHGNVS